MNDRITIAHAASKYGVPEWALHNAVEDGRLRSFGPGFWRRLTGDTNTYVEDGPALARVVERYTTIFAFTEADLDAARQEATAAKGLLAEVQRKAREEREAVPPVAEPEWLTYAEVEEKYGPTSVALSNWKRRGKITYRNVPVEAATDPRVLVADDDRLAEAVATWKADPRSSWNAPEAESEWITYRDAGTKYGIKYNTLTTWANLGYLNTKPGPYSDRGNVRLTLVADDDALAAKVESYHAGTKKYGRGAPESPPERYKTSQLHERYPHLSVSTIGNYARLGVLDGEQEDGKGSTWWIVDAEPLPSLNRIANRIHGSLHKQRVTEGQRAALVALGYDEAQVANLSAFEGSVLLRLGAKGVQVSGGDGQSTEPPALAVPEAVSPDVARLRAAKHRARADEYEAIAEAGA